MTVEAEASFVGPDSDVARFLFSGHLKKGRILRPNAFMPPDDDLKLSVCVSDGLETEAIHEWGALHASRDSQGAKGFALLHVANVLAENLVVQRDDSPPRHAEVFGWPEDKEARLDIAKQLASIAALQLRGS